MAFQTGFENWGSQGKYIPPVTKHAATHWWASPTKWILTGLAIGSLFVPGLRGKGAQFLINEGVAVADYLINKEIGAKQPVWSTVISFGLPAIFAGSEVFGNFRKFGQFSSPSKEFFSEFYKPAKFTARQELEELKSTPREFRKSREKTLRWDESTKGSLKDMPDIRYAFEKWKDYKNFNTRSWTWPINNIDEYEKASFVAKNFPGENYFDTVESLKQRMLLRMPFNASIRALGDISNDISSVYDIDELGNDEIEKMINILTDLFQNSSRLSQSSFRNEFALVSTLLNENPTEIGKFFLNIKVIKDMNPTKFLDAPDLTIALQALKDLRNYGEDEFMKIWGFKPFSMKIKNIAVKKSSFKDIIHWIGNSKSMKWTVRLTRMLNPTMIARLPENLFYRAAVKTFRKDWKYFRKFQDGLLKIGKPAIQTAEKANQILQEEGFVSLPSAWLLGIRLIENYVAGDLILISFQAGPTYGKAPVLVRANDEQMARLLTRPGNTYLDEWATTRGGASVSLADVFDMPDGEETGRILNKLNLLPTQAIRNLLSVASNLKKARNRNWSGQHIFKTMELYSISKASRFGSRVLFGDIANNLLGKSFKNNKKLVHFLKHVIPMESQRVGTLLATTPLRNILQGKKWSSGLKRTFQLDTAKVFRDQVRFGAAMKYRNGMSLKMVRGTRKSTYLRRAYKLFK